MTIPASCMPPASVGCKPASAGNRNNSFSPQRPRGLLEPYAGPTRTHGSEGAIGNALPLPDHDRAACPPHQQCDFTLLSHITQTGVTPERAGALRDSGQVIHRHC
jgi:hypothetical protein